MVATANARARVDREVILRKDPMPGPGAAGARMLALVRERQFDAGHIRDARHLPQDQVSGAAETLKKYKEKVVIACCESGMRSGAAARVLRNQGFSKVVNLRGGIQAWRAENLPLVKSGDKGK